MLKVSASREHARLQSYESSATGFWGRSFQIISSLVWTSSFVDGLLVQFV